jgi:formylglycine-generating enzyme required for sulfatase activity
MLLERLQATRPPPATKLPAIGSKSSLGEIYAGIARGNDSERDYHLWLCAENPLERMTWADAVKWAENLGVHASLPSRAEQALLFANLKDQFESECYWSGTQYAGYDEYAWYQTFSYGYQLNGHKDTKLRVRAVRRLPIE